MAAAVLFFTLILVFPPSMLFSQSPAASPTFEVASVKPSKPGSPGPTLRIDPGGRFTAEGITLRNLITLAWHIRDEELSGAPSWIDSARYDIVAKPAHAVAAPLSKQAREQQMLRLQALLVDRFDLRLHWNTRQRSVLALVPAKNGPKLEQALGSGAACRPAPDGPGLITSMEMFAADLSNRLGQPVIDQTGLRGFFCVRLRWTSEDGIPRSLGVRPRTGADVPSSIYSALQSQLGLRLQAQKGAIQILVVDHVAPPRPN